MKMLVYLPLKDILWPLLNKSSTGTGCDIFLNVATGKITPFHIQTFQSTMMFLFGKDSFG